MRSKFTSFFIIFLFFISSLSAQTTYTSNGTGDWDNPAIWTPNGVPGTGDIAIVNTGTITLTDNVTISGLYMSAGTITGDSNLTITDSLAWTAGVITFSTPAIEVKPTLTLAASAKANINGTFQVNRPLVNEGEIYWLKNNLSLDIYCYNYGTIFDKTNETVYITSSFGKVFYNYGKYIKSGSGTTQFRFTQFVNSGEVIVIAGSLNLSGSHTEETGSFIVGEQAYLNLGSPRVLSGPVRIKGILEFGGQYVVSVKGIFDIKGECISNAWGHLYFNPGSTLLLDSSMISVGGAIIFNTGKKEMIDSVRFIYRSSLVTNDSLVIRKYANFTQGWIGNNKGVIIFDKEANINVSGGNSFLGQINNYGNIYWNEGDVILYDDHSGGSTMINNYGFFIDKTDVSSNIKMPTGNGTSIRYFYNYGTYLKKNLSTSVFSNGVSFTNKENGILKGVGNITFVDPIVNAGTVSPGDSVGVLNLKLDYPSESTSSVNIDIGGTVADTQFDRLEIDGNATLKGTLNIQLLDAYIPDEGEVFEVMKFTSRTDTFDIVIGTEILNCRYFAVKYSDTSVRLEVYGIEPPQAEKDTISERQDRPIEINVLANDTDPDGDTLTVLSVGDPLHGTAIVNGDSTILYTPETGFTGLDSMIYVIQKRSGCIDSSWVVIDVLSTVGIEELPFDSPGSFSVEQNHPNPFNVSTSFNFSIPEKAYVEIRIYSIHGKLMDVLVSKKLSVGSYNYEYAASELREGIYFYQFSAGEFIQTGKMFKLK